MRVESTTESITTSDLFQTKIEMFIGPDPLSFLEKIINWFRPVHKEVAYEVFWYWEVKGDKNPPVVRVLKGSNIIEEDYSSPKFQPGFWYASSNKMMPHLLRKDSKGFLTIKIEWRANNKGESANIRLAKILAIRKNDAQLAKSR